MRRKIGRLRPIAENGMLDAGALAKESQESRFGHRASSNAGLHHHTRRLQSAQVKPKRQQAVR